MILIPNHHPGYLSWEAYERNQAMMLRRLARDADTAPLRTLVSIVEPVKEYRRYQQRPQMVSAPLTGLIDAARPDSEEGRRFNADVEALLSDAPRFASHAERRHTTHSSDHDTTHLPQISQHAGLNLRRQMFR